MAFKCTSCGAKLSLRELINDEDWQALLKLMATLPQGVPYTMLRYLELFTPNERGMAKPGALLRIVSELAPMIRDNSVISNRTTYRCPTDLWVKAMLYMIDTPPKTLKLPIKNNGYLIGMLANKCEKVAAEQENKIERSRRNRSGSDDGEKTVGELLEGLNKQ